MSARKHHVTDTELAVLQVLWDRRSATTREICDQLYPQGEAAQYYTVQKLLERLEARHCVKRDRSERIHRFSAAVDRDTLLAARLRDLSNSLCDGAVFPLLNGLLKLKRWNANERRQLQEILENLFDSEK